MLQYSQITGSFFFVEIQGELAAHKIDGEQLRGLKPIIPVGRPVKVEGRMKMKWERWCS